MAKEQTKIEEVKVKKEELPTPNIALGYCKDTTDGKWKVIRIDFSVENSQTKSPVVLEVLDSEADAVQRFKVRVAQDMMKHVRDQISSGAVR